MKRIVSLIMILSVVFCACGREANRKTVSDSGTGAAVGNAVTESAVSGSAVTGSAVSGSAAGEEVGSDSSSGMNVAMAKKDGPMLSERIDPDRTGIVLFEPFRYTEFATGPVKGDDGNCYYYRRERKKGGKITFYRNNGIKVCETVLPEKYEKDYFIDAFSKQGGRFWILFQEYESCDSVLVPVGIKDGKWGKSIKADILDRIIYYKDCIYHSYERGGKIKITDLKGNTKRIEFEEEEKRPTLQTIIDDKLYYIIGERESDICTVMRCDMDGSNKEELFRYNRVCSSRHDYCKLTLDGDFFYLFDPDCGFMLTRIPLYGGEVEEIVETDWYQLTGDSIYYMDEMGISRMDKDLKGGPESAVRLNWKWTGEVFYCADEHILAEIRDEEEWDKLETIWLGETDDKYFDIGMNYSSEYYWISEKGKVDNKIPGSGFIKKYQDWYESAKDYLEIYGPYDEFD